MKREAPSCSKMKRLCRLLDMPLYQAVGMLELLWHLTAREAARGDIGKLSNEDIALALDYRQDEDKLIETLIRTRWLDESAEYRLLVHDWHEHADEAVKKRLTRSGRSFISARHIETKPQSVETKPQNGNLPRAGAGPEPEPVPVPVPVPVPAPAPAPVKNKQKQLSRDKREIDQRHVPFRTEIEAYAAAKEVQFVWDESEAKQLSMLLNACPQLGLEDFKTCLRHRARSSGVPHGERPRVWLSNILKYQEGPLNEFGKTGVGIGRRDYSKTGGNIDAARGALAILAEARAARAANEVQHKTGSGDGHEDLSHLRAGSIEGLT